MKKCKQIIYLKINFIIKMLGNDFTTRKDYIKSTSHKSDFSFSSPQEEGPTVLKQALMESRRTQMMRNKLQLFADMKQNSELISLVSKSYSKDFVQKMRTQHRIQVEKLLLQISRLHDMLQQQDRAHRYAIQRIKQESEQISLLRISNIKQSQFSQIQMIQIQLRKTKQNLQQKNILIEELQKTSARKIQNLTNQNQSLKADLKSFVQKKNAEIYELKTNYNKQNQQSTRKQQQTTEQMKNLAEKQLKKVIKKLEQKQKDIQVLRQECQNHQIEKNNLSDNFQKEKISLMQKLNNVMQNQRQRQYQLIQNLKNYHNDQVLQSQEAIKRQKQLINLQFQQLLKVIQIKDKESQRNLIHRQTQKLENKLLLQNIQKQNDYLKKMIKQLKNRHLQQVQLLKVKMASLHQNDISSLVNLYQAKLNSIAKDLQFANSQAEKATNEARKQRQKLYELKKKYDYTISVLHEEILQLKIGMGHFEKDMKQKLENQKSMMIMTSRNFIKQNQLKNNNIRFYEEELRKLRQLLEIQAQQVQDSEKNVEQKIKLAQDQLTRLSNKIIQVKSEAEQTEKKLKIVIEQKNKQIKRLNDVLNNPKIANKNEDDKRSQIKRLDQQLTKKQDQIRILQSRIQNLQADLKMSKTQNERLIIQNQINSQQAKRHYKTLSDRNLADFKAFYERRLQQLQNDKKELGKVNSSQSEQITQLIKKYKQLEQGMRQLIKQNKKRSDLEARIIALGMDNNLVKNMGELFHK